MYLGDGDEEKRDMHKVIFLPRASKNYKKVRKFTPPSKAHLLASTDVTMANDSREVIHTYAITTVQLIICYGLIY